MPPWPIFSRMWYLAILARETLEAILFITHPLAAHSDPPGETIQQRHRPFLCCKPSSQNRQSRGVRMLDVHCHILPGVDDGPATVAESLAMARLCVADGITHITATPHCHRRLRLLRADILPEVAALNGELRRA